MTNLKGEREAALQGMGKPVHGLMNAIKNM